LRRLAGRTFAQVLVTLGIAFIIADSSLLVWSGDPMPLPVPRGLMGAVPVFGVFLPKDRLAVVGISIVTAVALWALLERTRLGAMIRAGVDDMEMARALGIPVPRLFTAVFCLGAALAGMGGVLGGPILSVYPGLDMDMLPLALVVLILGGPGSLPGAFAGSFFIGFLYTFGQALFPQLAYVILFLPMVAALVLRPKGPFGPRAACSASSRSPRVPRRCCSCRRWARSSGASPTAGSASPAATTGSPASNAPARSGSTSPRRACSTSPRWWSSPARSCSWPCWSAPPSAPACRASAISHAACRR